MAKQTSSYKQALYNNALPDKGKEMKYRIMRNIGVAQIKLGKYKEACTSFEIIMEASPDYRSGKK